MWMVQLLASALPSTLIMYGLGSFVTYKIRLTKITKIAGLFIAWLLTAVTALLMADETTVFAAQQKTLPAAAIGSIIAIVGIALAGRRK